VLLTAVVVMVTLATGKALLTSPVWTLVDNWSGGDELLRWYADRVEDATPSAWIVSVPASLWRALWVLWALWVAWQSIGWGRWAWRVIGEGGWLRTPPPQRSERLEVAAASTPDGGDGSRIQVDGDEQFVRPANVGSDERPPRGGTVPLTVEQPERRRPHLDELAGDHGILDPHRVLEVPRHPRSDAGRRVARSLDRRGRGPQLRRQGPPGVTGGEDDQQG
jgi:hypothetical protein